MSSSSARPRRRGTAALCVALCLLTGVSAAGTAQEQDPDASPEDFVLIELLLSMQGAVISSRFAVFATGEILDAISPCAALPDEDVSACEFAQSLRRTCIGSAWGFPLGATLGIALAGALFDVPGSILGAAIGSVLGELIGLPQCSLIRNFFGTTPLLLPPQGSDLSLVFNPVILSALGATLGYNVGLLM